MKATHLVCVVLAILYLNAFEVFSDQSSNSLMDTYIAARTAAANGNYVEASTLLGIVLDQASSYLLMPRLVLYSLFVLSY